MSYDAITQTTERTRLMPDLRDLQNFLDRTSGSPPRYTDLPLFRVQGTDAGMFAEVDVIRRADRRDCQPDTPRRTGHYIASRDVALSVPARSRFLMPLPNARGGE